MSTCVASPRGCGSEEVTYAVPVSAQIRIIGNGEGLPHLIDQQLDGMDGAVAVAKDKRGLGYININASMCPCGGSCLKQQWQARQGTHERTVAYTYILSVYLSHRIYIRSATYSSANDINHEENQGIYIEVYRPFRLLSPPARLLLSISSCPDIFPSFFPLFL